MCGEKRSFYYTNELVQGRDWMNATYKPDTAEKNELKESIANQQNKEGDACQWVIVTLQSAKCIN